MTDHTLMDQYERIVGKAVCLPNYRLVIRDSAGRNLAYYDFQTEVIKNAYDVRIGKAVLINSYYIIRNIADVKIGVYDSDSNVLKNSYDQKIGYGFAIQLLFDLQKMEKAHK